MIYHEPRARLIVSKTHQAITVRLAVDLKLFDHIIKRASEDKDGNVRLGQLAEDVKADPKLVGKFLFPFSVEFLGMLLNVK